MFQFVDSGYTAILEDQREKRLELEVGTNIFL